MAHAETDDHPVTDTPPPLWGNRYGFLVDLTWNGERVYRGEWRWGNERFATKALAENSVEIAVALAKPRVAELIEWLGSFPIEDRGETTE